MCRVNSRERLGTVMAFQPTAQSVKPRKKELLRDVGLVALVAHFPLDAGWDDDVPAQAQTLALQQPLVERPGCTRCEREECRLVDDTLIERRGLEEHHEVVRIGG